MPNEVGVLWRKGRPFGIKISTKNVGKKEGEILEGQVVRRQTTKHLSPLYLLLPKGGFGGGCLEGKKQ